MTETETHMSKLKTKFGDKIIKTEIQDNNCLKVHISALNLLELMGYISSELKFPSLEAVSGVDWETYFEVVYHIDRWDGDPTFIQVHVKLENRGNPEVPSLTSIWASADWHEREVFDLYGIRIIQKYKKSVKLHTKKIGPIGPIGPILKLIRKLQQIQCYVWSIKLIIY